MDAHALHFGFKTTQYIPYEDIRRAWLEADPIEEIDSAWLFDHPMPIGRGDPAGYCLDGWTTLAALAAQTSRLRLGLMVASNTNQTPPWLAKRAATVDVISGGRLEFGFGAGGGEREHTAYLTDLFPAAERVRRLEEAIQIIRRMWTERAVDFAGKYYQVVEAYCEPKPIQQPTPPFVIGGAGEQLTLRVVAKQADVWNFPGWAGVGRPDIGEFTRRNDVLNRHCEEIGRDPATIRRSAQMIVTREKPEDIREDILALIRAGASHFVIGMRPPIEGAAKWLAEEVIRPVREAVG